MNLPGMLRRTFIVLATIVLACAGGGLAGPGGEPPPNALRVLFIGNSLTYVNDLPAMVASLADSLDVPRPFWYRTAAFPNYALEDHWSRGETRSALEDQDWDFVVLQQGPSSLPENQVSLRDWSLQFAPLIRSAGARPALYMVWPESTRQQAFPAVAQAYTGAAEAVDGILFPVGLAWQEAWKQNPNLRLYGGDGFHPSTTGTYLAAMVIVDRLYTAELDRSPAALRVNGGVVSVSPAERGIMVQAAREANRQFGR